MTGKQSPSFLQIQSTLVCHRYHLFKCNISCSLHRHHDSQQLRKNSLYSCRFHFHAEFSRQFGVLLFLGQDAHAFAYGRFVLPETARCVCEELISDHAKTLTYPLDST